MSTKEAYVEEHGCSGSCSTCGENCEHKGIQKEKQNKKSNIKKTIAVVSGKGGVGKSFVTSLLASYLNKEGYNVGILDGDIVGPSIPKSFNLHTSAYGDEDQLIVPAVTKSGIKIISTNLMLEHEDDPIIWRGALITSLMRQFYSTVAWGELDVLLIDMPPGTGDVTLTVFQQIPIDEIVIADKKINFNAEQQIDIGGFCVSTFDYIFRWLIRGDTLCEVTIPEKEKIYIGN